MKMQKHILQKFRFSFTKFRWQHEIPSNKFSIKNLKSRAKSGLSWWNSFLCLYTVDSNQTFDFLKMKPSPQSKQCKDFKEMQCHKAEEFRCHYDHHCSWEQDHADLYKQGGFHHRAWALKLNFFKCKLSKIIRDVSLPFYSLARACTKSRLRRRTPK